MTVTTPTSPTSPVTSFWQRWHLTRYISAFIALIVVLALVSWAFLPGYVKDVATKQVQQQIGRKLEIDRISFSPFKLALTLNGIRLYEADQRSLALDAKELVVSVSLSSLFHQALVLDELQLTAADLHITRLSADGKGVYNFSDMLDKIDAMPKSDTPFRFAMANIQLKDSVIDIEDQVKAAHFKVTDLQIGIPFISNFPKTLDSFVAPQLSGRLNGAGFALNARAKPFAKSLDTTLALDVEQLNLAQYVEYLPASLPVQIARATLTTKLDLQFKREPQAQVLLSGEIHLKDVDLKDQHAADLLSFSEADAQIKQLNLLTAAAELTQVRVRQPHVWIDFSKKNGLNWANLSPSVPQKNSKKGTSTQEKGATTATAPVAAKTSPLITIAAFQIQEGAIHIADEVHAQPKQQLELQHLDLQVKGISTANDAPPATVALSLATSDEETIHFDGDLQALSGHAKGSVALNNLDLSHYQNFVSPFLHAKIDGKLNASTHLQASPGQLQFSELALDLHHAFVQGKSDEGRIDLASLVIDKAEVDTDSRIVTLPSVTLQGLVADIRRDQQGIVTPQHWLASGTPAASNQTVSTKASAAPSWKIQLGQVDLNDSEVAFADLSVTPSVKLKANGITMGLSHFSSDLSQPFKANLVSHINRQGQINLTAQATPQLKQITMAMDARYLPVASFYPYVSQLLNVEITKGTASAKGKFDIRDALQDQRQIAYNGNVSFNDFKIYENGSDDDFLEWKTIGLDGIDTKIGGVQDALSIKKLTLDRFFARLVLSDKAQLNLQHILVNKAAGGSSTPNAVPQTPQDKTTENATLTAPVAVASAPTSVKKPMLIRIGQTELRSGNINFTDNFIKPNYHANLTNVSGTIGLLAPDSAQPANVELHGNVDNDAPLLIAGAMNPLASPLFLDITGSTNGLELTRLTPYAAKYAGYPIEKGKLSMQVSYHIENQQLKADNSITLDQLTFGEHVDGPNVTKLPVMLAVALLRDNQGRIAINLPISGSLSDPQFSVGGIIFKVFVNLITKAVTSPFALLGSMFGGGEQLAYVEFNPGLAVLPPGATEKLDTLAKALNNRSSLKLDIVGRVDPVTDSDGVRQSLLASKLRDAKWRELHQKDRSIKMEDVTVTSEERAKYVQVVYQSEKFDKPRNLIGLTKTLPADQAEALILKNLPVSADDLRALAQKREDVVRDYLETNGKVDRDRLFLIAPKLDGSDIKDQGTPNRVDFSLK